MNSATLDSAILHKTLTQTNSIWLNIIHSHSTWWCQPSWNLPSSSQPFWTKKTLTHSFWLNLMMAAILNSPILDSDTAILDWDTLLSSLRFTQNTLTPHWIWLKQIQSASNSFVLTQLDDVSHLEFCHLGFNHFEQIKTSLIHCHSTWGWQPSWILPSWIWPSWIQLF